MKIPSLLFGTLLVLTGCSGKQSGGSDTSNQPSTGTDGSGTCNTSSVAWTTSGSDIMFSGGKVGVGTTSPAYALDVVGDLNITGNFKVNGVNVSAGGGGVSAVSATSPLVVANASTTPSLSLGGLTGLGSANQILGMDAAGSAYEYKTISGTADQINVAHSANSLILSTPQNIGTSSSPSFAGLTLSSFSSAGFVKNNASGVISGGNQVGLGGSDITGVLGVANGGTGLASLSAGALLYASTSSVLSQIPAGTSGQVLTSNGAGSAPSWQTPSGGGGGSGGGVTWQMIASTDLSSSATSYTFSGLDGNVDEEYMVIGRVVTGVSGAASFAIRPNGDGTGANYRFQNDYGQSSSAGACAACNPSAGLGLTYANADTGQIAFGRTLIYAKTGGNRAAIGQDVQAGSSGGINATETTSSYWLNTSSNITSLQIASNVSNAMGAGTHLEVWAKRANSGSSQWISSGSDISFSTGNVGIGTNSPAALLHVNGSALATAWNTSSDARLKTNVVEIGDSLEKISRLRGVTFDWRTDVAQPTRHERLQDIGVIAQEVEKVFPEAVTTGHDGFKEVAYAKLVAPLIEAVKSLYHRLSGVESHQAAQEREVASLRQELADKDKKLRELEERVEQIEKTTGVHR